MTRSSIATGCLAALLALTACSSSGSSGSSAKTTAAASAPASASASTPATASSSAPASAAGGGTTVTAPVITIKNFGFSGNLTVTPGQKVSVVNNDSAAHTLTDKASHLFDTGNLAAGGGKGTFVAPTKPGSYPFGCTYHPDMAGTLVVKG